MKTKPKPKIKPCPFCGEKRNIYWYLKESSFEHEEHQYWYVLCLKCRAEGPVVKHSLDIPKREEVAIILWNARK
jgi:Lar family restriction alleviation protein